MGHYICNSITLGHYTDFMQTAMDHVAFAIIRDNGPFPFWQFFCRCQNSARITCWLKKFWRFVCVFNTSRQFWLMLDMKNENLVRNQFKTSLLKWTSSSVKVPKNLLQDICLEKSENQFSVLADIPNFVLWGNIALVISFQNICLNSLLQFCLQASAFQQITFKFIH